MAGMPASLGLLGIGVTVENIVETLARGLERLAAELAELLSGGAVKAPVLVPVRIEPPLRSPRRPASRTR